MPVSIRSLLAIAAALSSAATVFGAPVENPIVEELVPVYADGDANSASSRFEADAAMATARVYFCQNIRWGGDCAYMNVEEGRCANLPSAWNDRISSIRNEDTSRFKCIWYQNGNCGGASYDNQNDANLADGNGRFNDFISSMSCNRK